MGSFGLGICYDIRFPELAMMAQRRGCIAMLYPGAFTMTTGRLHWDLLLRSRCVCLRNVRVCVFDLSNIWLW